jgi:hypothetical protein
MQNAYMLYGANAYDDSTIGVNCVVDNVGSFSGNSLFNGTLNMTQESFFYDDSTFGVNGIITGTGHTVTFNGTSDSLGTIDPDVIVVCAGTGTCTPQ